MAAKHVVLITGGNTGLGLETVRALRNSPRPYEIIIGSRSLHKADAAIKELEAEPTSDGSTTLSSAQIDVEDDASISKAFETINSRFGKLDVLINNAGANFQHEVAEGRISVREGWNKAWNTNVAGTYIVTDTFVPLLLKSDAPRIVFITSGLSTLTQTTLPPRVPAEAPPPKGWPKNDATSASAYKSSKTGMNMMVREWARVLGNDGVKIFLISPGILVTGLNNSDPEFLKKIGGVHPSSGANVVRSVVEGERDADEGLVVRKDGIQPW